MFDILCETAYCRSRDNMPLRDFLDQY